MTISGGKKLDHVVCITKLNSWVISTAKKRTSFFTLLSPNFFNHLFQWIKVFLNMRDVIYTILLLVLIWGRLQTFFEWSLARAVNRCNQTCTHTHTMSSTDCLFFSPIQLMGGGATFYFFSLALRVKVVILVSFSCKIYL